MAIYIRFTHFTPEQNYRESEVGDCIQLKTIVSETVYSFI